MAAITEAVEANMDAYRWFDGGGQMEELQRISTIKDAAKKQAALQQFNERNTDFLDSRFSGAQPPSLPEKAKTHPAVDEAITDVMRRESADARKRHRPQARR
jgi:hypothetical protein